MEYSSTINNWAFVTHFPELGVKEAVIVDFLSRYAQSPFIQKKVYEGKVFYWFSYDKISKELSILKIGERRVRELFPGLIKAEILEAHPENSGGRTFFAFGSRYPLTHARATAQTLSEKGQDLNETSAENRQGKPKPRRKNDEGLAEKRQGLGETSAENRQHISKPIIREPNQLLDEIENSLSLETETQSVEAENPLLPPSCGAPPASPASPASPVSPALPGGFDIVSEGDAIKNDPRFLTLFARAASITSNEEAMARLPKAVDVFVEDQIGLCKTYNNTTEFRRHFMYWVARVVARSAVDTTAAKPSWNSAQTKVSFNPGALSVGQAAPVVTRVKFK